MASSTRSPLSRSRALGHGSQPPSGERCADPAARHVGVHAVAARRASGPARLASRESSCPVGCAVADRRSAGGGHQHDPLGSRLRCVERDRADPDQRWRGRALDRAEHRLAASRSAANLVEHSACGRAGRAHALGPGRGVRQLCGREPGDSRHRVGDPRRPGSLGWPLGGADVPDCNIAAAIAWLCPSACPVPGLRALYQSPSNPRWSSSLGRHPGRSARRGCAAAALRARPARVSPGSARVELASSSLRAEPPCARSRSQASGLGFRAAAARSAARSRRASRPCPRFVSALRRVVERRWTVRCRFSRPGARAASAPARASIRGGAVPRERCSIAARACESARGRPRQRRALGEGAGSSRGWRSSRLTADSLRVASPLSATTTPVAARSKAAHLLRLAAASCLLR